MSSSWGQERQPQKAQRLQRSCANGANNSDSTPGMLQTDKCCDADQVTEATLTSGSAVTPDPGPHEQRTILARGVMQLPSVGRSWSEETMEVHWQLVLEPSQGLNFSVCCNAAVWKPVTHQPCFQSSFSMSLLPSPCRCCHVACKIKKAGGFEPAPSLLWTSNYFANSEPSAKMLWAHLKPSPQKLSC